MLAARRASKLGACPGREGTTIVNFHAVDNAGNSEANQSLTVKLDKTAPQVSCGSSEGSWHGDNVSIGCIASDTGSALANPADASFSLTTNLGAGTETATASTNSRSICDSAGLCAPAGPVGGNKIDRKAPAITITKPVGGDVYKQGQAVAASYSCSDGGVGGGSCAGTVPSGANVDTGSNGTKTFIVTATDALGNSASSSVTYTVQYNFTGFIGLSTTVLNGAKQNSSVLIRFGLGGFQGMNVLGASTQQQIDCATRALIGSASPATSSASQYVGERVPVRVGHGRVARNLPAFHSRPRGRDEPPDRLQVLGRLFRVARGLWARELGRAGARRAWDGTATSPARSSRLLSLVLDEVLLRPERDLLECGDQRSAAVGQRVRHGDRRALLHGPRDEPGSG